MNLGSPDSTEVKDVRKYLNEFLMDGRVIDIPYLLRLILVKGIIVPFRASKSAEAYRSIWWKEGSPLIELTRQLQKSLQQQVGSAAETGKEAITSAIRRLKKWAGMIEEAPVASFKKGEEVPAKPTRPIQ